MKGIPGRPGWLYVFFYSSHSFSYLLISSYKCDSQCALEMRCPPGLVFDDIYQRCEWPGASSLNQRLGSLRDKKHNDRNTTKTKVKKLHLMTTLKQLNGTSTTLLSSSSTTATTTVSPTNQTTKLVEP